MKIKILNALQTKYKTFGFSEKAFDGVADYLSKTVTEENQIETTIGGVEGLLKAFQGEVDYIRNEKSGLQKQLDSLKLNQPKEPIKEPAKEEIPSWAQSLIEGNKTLSEKLTAFEQTKKEQDRKALILSKAQEFGIPETFATRLQIPEDANLDTYMGELKQEFANIGFEGVKSPEVAGEPKNEGEALISLITEGTKEIINNKQN